MMVVTRLALVAFLGAAGCDADELSCTAADCFNSVSVFFDEPVSFPYELEVHFGELEISGRCEGENLSPPTPSDFIVECWDSHIVVQGGDDVDVDSIDIVIRNPETGEVLVQESVHLAVVDTKHLNGPRCQPECHRREGSI